MKTIFSPLHAGHSGQMELMSGAIVPGFEKPSRAEFVRARVEAVKLGPVLEPENHDLAAAKRVHDPAYVDFLPTVWPQWQALGRDGSAMAYAWPVRGLRGDVRPRALDAALGFYSFDGGATFVEGTWTAVKSSFDTALSAAALVDAGERAAFALCRPPGHHAGRAFMGGYCFINNAAVAAQWLRDRGAARVSILDVDYHHGNGTQEIFYDREDVLLASLHGDPDFEFPFHLGYARERGAGRGEGFNLNYPLPAGTTWPDWQAAFEDAHARIGGYAPTALVVSLGVDTFKDDPISQFRLESGHFLTIGRRIADLALPTLFVMEGGYAVDALGVNAVNVLQGFEGA